MKYIAFLRGINVGGNSTVRMVDLKETLEQSGFTNVITLLNSGNVILETDGTSAAAVAKTIEETLEKAFKFPIRVILRSEKSFKELLAHEPFKHVKITPTLRVNVTLLGEPTTTQVSSASDFQIVQCYADAICTAVDRASGKGSTEMMTMLEKVYGKNITTRTWNTLQRIGKLLEA